MRVFAVAFFVCSAAFAQSPSADWRTLSTPHFRVHYTAPAEEWTRFAAARLEAIRERVVEEVGYGPPEVVDVIVSDPVANPNGMAYPLLGSPRMVLWTSPPGPESAIGHYGSWPELLLVHEETHLVHLLRPSRNPLRRLLARMVPAGPLAWSSPRWVTEGYATVVEGRLTGSGRPNGDLRAALLRRWAQTGKLPSYGRLASDAETWQGQSLAYLLGSAYLEWLEERAGPGSLKALWARMSAKRARSFEDAFAGVFGDSPENLYDRFRAELTWRALEAERLRAPSLAQGELVADLSWTTGAPALSPDGKRLALVLRGKDQPSRLVVWSTEPDAKAEEEWETKRDEILARDPEDVAAVRTRPLPKKALFTLAQTDGVEPTMPRFLPDGGSILFVRFEPDAQGFLHPDLFVWTFETGAVRRVTHGADLRDPDPAPDGSWAVATRNRHGFSQLVRVDLASGEVDELTLPSIETIVDQPRVSPDGTRIAYACHTGEVWEIVVQDPLSSEIVTLSAPPDGTLAAPAWSRDGKTLYATVGAGGFLDLYAFPILSSLPPFPLTRTQGAALAPEPSPDGSALFFLSLEPGGLDLRRLELPGEARAYPAPARLAEALAPAVRPVAPAAPAVLPVAEVEPARPYGLGRQEISWLFGGSGASDGGSWEGGVRGGDVLGRLDWLAVGAVGSGGWTAGGALAAAWRGWPVELSLHLWDAAERPTRGFDVPERGNLLDRDRSGLELGLGWDWTASGERLRLGVRSAWETVEGPREPSIDRRGLAAEGAFALFRQRGPLRLDLGLSGRYEAGRTAGRSLHRWGGEIDLGVEAGDQGSVAVTWSRHGSRDALFAFDLYALGGGESTLLPRSVTAGRIAEPALPLGVLLGAESESQRIRLELPWLPAPVFFARHRLWRDGQRKGEWLSLAGIEARWRLDPQPLLVLPAFDLRAGLAVVLDEPFADQRLEDELRWWLLAVWRP